MDIRANTALYIRAIDGRFSILHKVEEEEIDARFNNADRKWNFYRSDLKSK